MADIADVENVLVGLAAAAAYPNGTGQASATGFQVKAYPGWPNPQQLDADLLAGTCHVSVFPMDGERNTTRYPQDWQILSIQTPSLTLTITGQTVTVGGTMPLASNPHNVCVLANGLFFAYAVQVADTLTSIATALAAIASVSIAGTTSTGPVITFPATAKIAAARVGVTGSMIQEMRRQERLFKIITWCNTPANRDVLSQLMDGALTAYQFITMPDGTAARLVYKSTHVADTHELEQIYRRDLVYSVEYATTKVVTATQVTQITESFYDQTSTLIKSVNI